MNSRDWKRLKQEEIAARQYLLSINPLVAQSRVQNMLCPDLWSVDVTENNDDEDEIWDASATPSIGLDCLDDLSIPNLRLMKQTPDKIKNIIKALQDMNLNVVLVGGQAINFWAIHYQKDCPEINQYIPFSSEDIDFFGGRLEASLAHEILGGELVLNRNFDPSPNAGVLTTKLGSSSLRIDFLASVYGLNDDEITRTALVYEGEAELASLKLAVLNPILCLEGKLSAAVGLPQYGRQDIKHLKMSVLIVQAYLNQICQKKKPRTGLKLVERIYNRAKNDAGLQVKMQYGIEIDAAIPLAVIQKHSSEQWQRFCTIRLPQLQKELSDRQVKYENLMQKKKN